MPERFLRVEISITYVFSMDLHRPIPPAGITVTFLLLRSSKTCQIPLGARQKNKCSKTVVVLSTVNALTTLGTHQNDTEEQQRDISWLRATMG
jgi:hypothetical protein